jgi:hypothetical protein
VLGTVSLAVAAIAILHRLGRDRGPQTVALGLLGATGGWFAVALLPQSLPLTIGAYSYDRYFLPMLPLVVAGLLTALRPVRILTPMSWVVVSGMAGFSIAATHDHLAMQRATWELAAEARADGVPLTGIDAGVAWDGYHHYERDRAADVKIDLGLLRDLGFTGPLVLSERDDVAWWIPYYAPSISSRVVVSGDRLYGYEVVERLEYSSWLHGDPQHVYLLQRPD